MNNIFDIHPSLLEAIEGISHLRIFESIILTEDRIDFLKQKNQSINTEHDPLAAHKDASAIIDHLASVDPTKNKANTQWMVNLYKKGGFKQEDAYKVGESLGHFNNQNIKKRLDKKDINQYKSVGELHTAIEPHIGTAETNKEADAQLKSNLDIDGHRRVYDDENISIYHLSDKATSQKLYGKMEGKACKTDWCTAASDKYNMFDVYTKDKYSGSKIHVVHRKSDGAVFQYHAESNQFMDAKDNRISHEDFSSIQPSLHKAWKQNPELV